MNFFKTRRFTPLHLVILCVLASSFTFFASNFFEKKQNEDQLAHSVSPICKIDIKRLSGLKFIKPIMFVDEECESDDLSGLKQRISEIINRYKSNQDANSASFYLKRYNNNDWTCLNCEEKYEPGSLFKVPVLITILKMNEMTPGFLGKVVTYNKKFDIQKDVAYNSRSIELGKSYSVRDLLVYMIKYSDNNATALLESYMKPEVFQKVFEDFGLNVPKLTDPQYFVTAKEYSFFMRGIYNAAYLNIEDSEYAAELLTQCQFRNGIAKGIPTGTLIAHKFGESGNQTERQLHESGIVYLNGTSYLLTIMTKGKDNDKLSKLIAEISQTVYVEMSNYDASTM